MITERQQAFIASLLNERVVDPARAEELKSTALTKQKASEAITWLLAQPRHVVPQASQSDGAVAKVPPGRYAIENEQGELRFYQLWQSKNGARRNLYVMFGPSAAKLYPKTQESICQKILDAGVRECAIRFGREIGACSNCGRQLTNRISRELGIGPICGDRMFEDRDAWKEEVKQARARLIAQGVNPDEELLAKALKLKNKIDVLTNK